MATIDQRVQSRMFRVALICLALGLAILYPVCADAQTTEPGAIELRPVPATVVTCNLQTGEGCDWFDPSALPKPKVAGPWLKGFATGALVADIWLNCRRLSRSETLHPSQAQSACGLYAGMKGVYFAPLLIKQVEPFDVWLSTAASGVGIGVALAWK